MEGLQSVEGLIVRLEDRGMTRARLLTMRAADQACIVEHELFCQVLDGANVTRETHILSGDLSCTYVIKRRL